MKKITIILCCLLCTQISAARIDSTYVLSKSNVGKTTPEKIEFSNKQFNLNRLHHSFCAPVPLAAIGLTLIPADKYINDKIVQGAPSFGTTIDEYTQYAPIAAQLIMGLSGVKGVSKNRWHLLATDVIATGVMAAATKGLKHCVGRTRPNGESHSFPSGHSAIAFMGATLLAHEYGHRSVWIPVAGYTVATATAAMRVLNNVHYVSDVIVGAAIGILSAEIAYWLSDVIFKDKKIFCSRCIRLHHKAYKHY